ncbi:uncharacterized protein LDX57_011339 [Aspergillus melleus]|uniref:uncharacterized protein n=1 Tax=Aspergillus melleus TaxID=138277 RepID=UPI001E8EE3FF|nr:uncharacterized protein LDX57_011339 [Aspergillus melleus]KAH8433705.1 hypothetical protein LDX57_011339 [Aspergillus melleus]
MALQQEEKATASHQRSQEVVRRQQQLVSSPGMRQLVPRNDSRRSLANVRFPVHGA